MRSVVVGRVSANAFVGNDGKARCSLTLTAQAVKFLGAGKGGQDVEVHAGQAAEATEDCPFEAVLTTEYPQSNRCRRWPTQPGSWAYW